MLCDSMRLLLHKLLKEANIVKEAPLVRPRQQPIRPIDRLHAIHVRKAAKLVVINEAVLLISRATLSAHHDK